MAKRRYSNRQLNPGYEAAKRHIYEAQQLTQELGGADQDVKRYFFSLPQHELKTIFSQYGEKFGRDKQDYAEKTFSDWKSGRRKMSGTVASRLFSLLPPKMPLKKKYDLVESLWRHLGHKSNITFTVGDDVTAEEVIKKVTDHTLAVVIEFKIPENFEKRFEWLAAGDVEVRQKLLNHFQELERKSIIDGANHHVSTILNHLASLDGIMTHSATQEIIVGKHSVRLEFERDHNGITEGSIRPQHLTSETSKDNLSLTSLIIGIGVLIVLVVLFSG